MNIFLPLAFSLVIYLSFIGWGALVSRIINAHENENFYLNAAWGISLTIAFGGILNLFKLISKNILIIYVAIGLILLIISLRKFNWNNFKIKYSKHKVIMLLMGFILILYTIKEVNAIQVFSFDSQADFQGYLVFPFKMLETGSLGVDPFNERRLTALGGNSLLHAITLSFLPIENVNIIDNFIGFFLIMGTVEYFIFKFEISFFSSIIIMAIVLFVQYPTGWNITSNILPIGLFLSLLATIELIQTPNNKYIRNAFAIALLSSAICSLKSNLIPACVIFVFSCFIYYARYKNFHKSVIYEFLMTFIILFALLIPWMIAMKISSGTFLYPLLGKGFHGSSYGIYPSLYGAPFVGVFIYSLMIFSALIFPANIYLGYYYIKFRNDNTLPYEPYISMLLASNLGTAIMLFAAAGYFAFAYRYAFCFVFASFLIMTILFLSMLEKKYLNSNVYSIVAIILIGAVIGQGYTETIEKRNVIMKNIESILTQKRSSKSFFDQTERMKYIKMQKAIPGGQILLARLSYPFLLDFDRNEIWAMDVPGGASLPPGLPIFQDNKKLLDYFASRGIKYIAYSYKDECNHPQNDQELNNRLNNKMIPWLRLSTMATFDFQQKLMELSKKCNKIYDDGENFVLMIQ